MSEVRDGMRAMIIRGRLEAVEDDGDMQMMRLKGRRGEMFSGVPRVQPFGFSSNPPAGSHGLMLGLGGRHDRAMAIGVEHPASRPRNVSAGGTVIYDANGQAVSLVEHQIRLVSAQRITLKAPEIVLEGLVKLGGADADKPASMEGTTDTSGDADVGNFATKVLMK